MEDVGSNGLWTHMVDSWRNFKFLPLGNDCDDGGFFLVRLSLNVFFVGVPILLLFPYIFE